MLPARPDAEFLAADEDDVIKAQAATAAAAAAAAAAMSDDEAGASDSAAAAQSPLPHSQHTLLSAPHVGPVSCVRWSSSGEYMLSGGQDRTVNLWSPLKSKHIKTYAGHHGREVLGLALSALSDRFVSCGGDRAIYLMDVSSGECIRRLRAHESAVNAVAFNADAGIIASGGYDKSLRLWDARSHSRDPIQSMVDAKDSVTGVIIREHSVYASSMDGCVRRYDVRMASRTTDHIAQPVSALSLSHDGNCLLLSCLDSSYRLMDVASGELLNEYAGATAKEYRMECCFENSDGFVVGGSETGEILVWDLVTAAVRHRYLGHTGAVSSVQWNPKSKSFVSAGVDGTIRMWK